MFTGIIKALGHVRQLQRTGGDVRLVVASDGLDWRALSIGDSISVNGVCLTAVEFSGGSFTADVSVETLNVTALDDLKVGSSVNLEPALVAGQPLGGHLVSGHVDCVGTVRSRSSDARSIVLSIDIPSEYARYVARKGSVCVDGVSLTINEVSKSGFDVNIIPHTADVTTIGGFSAGTRVNIEVDMLARYLERLLDPDGNGITRTFLRANGYA